MDTTTVPKTTQDNAEKAEQTTKPKKAGKKTTAAVESMDTE